MDRDQVERDLERFSALAPTLGRDSEIELLDPQLDVAVRLSMDGTGSWWLPTEPIGVPLFRRRDMTRRKRILTAARARKARRGWR